MWRENNLPPFDFIPSVQRPPIKWPNGARIAVWAVPNIEYFRPELMFKPAPEPRSLSHRDYGNRVGVWRLMDAMAKYNFRGTIALNAEVGIHHPRILEETNKLGWELMGHSLTNSISMSQMTPEEEADAILGTRKIIEQFGQKMRGWLGPGLTETWHTLDLLKDAGVEYTCDWVNDDAPYRMDNGIYSIPYTMELNDIVLFSRPSVHTSDFQQRIEDAFDALYAEGETSAKVMCIALHPFLIGQPHRIKYFDLAMRHITSHPDVWLATGSEIINAYKAQEMPGSK